LITYQPVSSIATNIPMTFTGFVNAGSGALVFDWDFGDGTSATGQVVYHTYTNANTFPITLTVSGPACPTTRSDRVTINLDVAPGQSIENELVYLPIIIKSATGATSTGMPPSVSGPMPAEVSIPALAIGPGSPAQVTDLQGYEPGDGTTRLAWTANGPGGAVLGYRVYRSPAGLPSFELAAEVPAAVTTYTDNEAACGQMYFVTAYNDQGESLPSTASYFSPPCP
jgi:PKD repeat protein